MPLVKHLKHVFADSPHHLLDALLHAISQAELLKSTTILECLDIDEDGGIIMNRLFTSHPMFQGPDVRLSYNCDSGHLRILIRPSRLHDVVQPWMKTAIEDWRAAGLLTPNDVRSLQLTTGDPIPGFNMPHDESVKQPDLVVWDAMNELPQFVIETDYAGSEYDLKEDIGLWL